MVRLFSSLYLRQLVRLMVELGLIRAIIFLTILILISAPILYRGYTNPVLLIGLAFIIIFSIHLHRKDKSFLQVVLKNEKLLYLIHYNIISIPAYIALLLSGNQFYFICLIVAISAISFIPIVSASYGNTTFLIFRNIPIRNFEFKSGVRKYRSFILFLYLSALILYDYSYVALGVILLLTFVSTLFYSEAEPRQMLEIFRLSSEKFLFFKIKNQLKDFWIICLPLVVLFLIMNTEYWYVLLVFMIISSIIQALSICLKYTFYEPEINIDNGIFIGIYAMSIFIPFLVPVPMVMLVYYYRRAISNLNNYLYDYP